MSSPFLSHRHLERRGIEALSLRCFRLTIFTWWYWCCHLYLFGCGFQQVLAFPLLPLLHSSEQIGKLRRGQHDPLSLRRNGSPVVSSTHKPWTTTTVPRHHHGSVRPLFLAFSSSTSKMKDKDSTAKTKKTSKTDDDARTTTLTVDMYNQWIVGECIGSGSYGTVHYLEASPIKSSNSGSSTAASKATGDSTQSSSSSSKEQQQPQQEREWFVGKRPWRASEIATLLDESKNPQERHERCLYYWTVEAHCFGKLPRHPQLPPYYGTIRLPSSSSATTTTPTETTAPSKKPGKKNENDDDEWMIFGPVLSTSSNGASSDLPNSSLLPPSSSSPPPLAKSLAFYMELDWQQQNGRIPPSSSTMTTTATLEEQEEEEEGLLPRRLPNLGRALNCATDASTLDTLFSSLLSVLTHIHESQIVHRDLKPSNILIAPDDGQDQTTGDPSPTQQPGNNVILIDFGSAADLEPISGPSSSSSFSKPFSTMKKYVGLNVNEQRVAVSPLYCAPEIFIDPQKAPLAFDLSSCGLIFCQFLFGFLDERSEAGFRQQLLAAAASGTNNNNNNPDDNDSSNYDSIDNNNPWDLNRWLANQLASKVRPEGLEDALAYLGDRPGLWRLLQDLLQRDPRDRPTALQAYQRLIKVLKRADLFQVENEKDDGTDDGSRTRMDVLEREDGSFFAMVVESIESCQIPSVSRPLHFVATFSRNKPLGLVFSELDRENDNDDDDDDKMWIQATKDAIPGEVFVRDIVPGGQADELGIFEIGDRLQGIGELTFTAGGFEKAVEMLQDQPRSSKYVRLHFDRIKVRDNAAIEIFPPSETHISIVDQGVWSTKGRRQTQEDAFVLHEIHATADRSVLLMGVMDGHGGTSASKKVSTTLPTELTDQIVVNRRPLESALTNAWEIVCRSYQVECQDQDLCVADYDTFEGVLKANTGSKDLVAGTTATVMALDETNGELIALNCGDSRSIIVTADGRVQLATKDHTPETEYDRIQEGINIGLDYSVPTCKISKWTISAGKYEYSVGRSLEGPFVTSKGIVNDADVTSTFVGVGEILVCATDGLWEVMDTEEVAMDVAKMRKQGMNARDSARTICSMALRKGTSDNVSVVVVYL